MLLEYDKYDLIGIGDFSHGDTNIWYYRFNMIIELIEKTNKNIIIFNEDTEEHCNSIMNINKKLSYNKKYDVINNYPYGPLEKYSYRVYDSFIYLQIIKFIRKHIDRIIIIGVDNGEISRDKYMSNIILENIDINSINLFWAHNAHIDSRKITEKYETHYSNEKFRSGYYLKKKLKNKYCIILSTGYKGSIRFDCKCDDNVCSNRVAFKIPKFKNIYHSIYKKYANGNEYDLYQNFKENIIEYTACIFPRNHIEITNKEYNYILFFSIVNELELI